MVQGWATFELTEPYAIWKIKFQKNVVDHWLVWSQISRTMAAVYGSAQLK